MDVDRFSAPVFRAPSNFLGNIGEPLNHGTAGEYALDEDEAVVSEIGFRGSSEEVYGAQGIREQRPVASI